MKLATALLGGALLLGSSTARAEEPQPKITYEKFTLANGLDVFLIEDHESPTVYEILWFDVGSKDETSKRTGFAHLFEHLMFKGSSHVPDGMMDKLLEEAGGWSNAFTSNDMTVYQNVAASNFLEQMLWLESDRCAGLLDTFDKAKLDNQRDVVLNEKRQGIDNQPYGVSEIILAENLWPAAHGYHWSVIGYTADLKAAAVPDVSNFFKTYYVPNNATLVLAGDIDVKATKALVEKYFAWIPKAATPKRPTYKTPAPITKEIVVSTTDDVQVPKVFLQWRGPMKFTADEPAMDLLGVILGGGKSSRLHKRLVYTDKIAQGADAGFYAAMIGGTFGVELTAKPGTDPKALIKAANEEIAKLAKDGPTKEELERAQATHESGFLHKLEGTMQRAIQLAEYDVQAKDPDYFAKDLARYRAVTTDQIKQAAATYLKQNQRVTLTISPGAKQKDIK